jgi:hypothetical protein
MKKYKIFLKNTFLAIGITSSFITILWAFFPTQLYDAIKESKYIYLFILFALSILYGFSTIRKKKIIKIDLSERVKVKVYYGDLFECSDIIIIPVNEYFDTLVDNVVISENTIHGIFINKYFSNDERTLKKLILKGLGNAESISKNIKRNKGNKKKYSLGTVSIVERDKKVFYLVAFTRFNENNRAEVKNSEYQRVLSDMFAFIEQNSQGRAVNIPLLGGGHSGVNLTKQNLLDFLIFSIKINDRMTLINGLNIILHSSLEKEIYLNKTEILFNTIEN